MLYDPKVIIGLYVSMTIVEPFVYLFIMKCKDSLYACQYSLSYGSLLLISVGNFEILISFNVVTVKFTAR